MAASRVQSDVHDQEMKLLCADCHVCCELSHLTINIHYTEASPFDVYFGNGGTAYIKKRDDGRCIYLTDEGCSVYAERPTTCSSFTCEKFLDDYWDDRYDEATVKQTIEPLRAAARALRRRHRQSLARRFNEALRQL